MTADRKAEIPSGYVWKNLPGINVQVPMPDNWFVLGIFMPATEDVKVLGTHLFQISRESIPQKGMFTTGAAIYGFTDFSKNAPENIGDSVSPVDFARGILRKLPIIQPIGEVTETEDDPLVVCRRRFILPIERWMTIPSFHGELVTKKMAPSHFCYMAVGNRVTDTAYLAWFETPSVKWKDDKAIAETILNNIIFDKSI